MARTVDSRLAEIKLSGDSGAGYNGHRVAYCIGTEPISRNNPPTAFASSECISIRVFRVTSYVEAYYWANCAIVQVMSNFGLIIPGRPVDTNFQQVDANKFLITILSAESVNHVVLFLTGLLPLPTESAACIFFSLPNANAAPTWNYLGHISNDKPSAIYKLTNLTQSSLRCLANDATNNTNLMPMVNNSGLAFNYVQAPVLHAQIGISIEPVSFVAGLVPAVETTASKANTFAEFINKTVSNLYNYCSSFSKPVSELVASQNPFQAQVNAAFGSDIQYVPLKTIQTWYENYTRRLSNDTDFWKSLAP